MTVLDNNLKGQNTYKQGHTGINKCIRITLP